MRRVSCRSPEQERERDFGQRREQGTSDQSYKGEVCPTTTPTTPTPTPTTTTTTTMTTPSSEVWQSDSAKQSVHEFPKGDESIIAARRRRRRRGRRSKTDKELRQQKQKKKLGREEGRHQQKSQQRQQTLGRGREREGRHRFLHRQISPHSSAAGAQAHRKDVLPHSEKTRRRAVRGDFASGPNHPSAVSDSVAGLAVIPKNREDEAPRSRWRWGLT